MTGTGKSLAAIALGCSLLFVVGTGLSAVGCGGSGSSFEPAERDEVSDKVAQDKMREYMQENGPKIKKKSRP